MPEALRPRQPIRRFDVFAEYKRLESLKRGHPDDEAKGYGLWVAKVVASGGGRGSRQRTEAPDGAHAAASPDAAPPHEKFRTLGGEEQTDRLFDREIVERMGPEFYDRVFAPTIAGHFERGESYESIRDRVRSDWKPA